MKPHPLPVKSSPSHGQLANAKASIPIPRLIAILLLSAVSAATAVPSTILSPVDGNVVLTSGPTEGAWSFNQHKSGGHTTVGGVGGLVNGVRVNSDDTFAWDCNLQVNGNKNADAGQPVYAIADGYIDTSVIGWGGSSSGQVLLRHTAQNGSTYYSGTVHLTNLITRTNNRFVSAGTILGNVGRVGATNDHLHFAVYDQVNGRLVSRNSTIIPTTAAARRNRAPSLTTVNVGQSLGNVTLSFNGYDPDGDAMIFEAVITKTDGATVSMRKVQSVRGNHGTATFPLALLGQLTTGLSYNVSVIVIDSKAARSFPRTATFRFNRIAVGSGALAMDHFANLNEGIMGYWTGQTSQDNTFDYRRYSSGNSLAQRRGSSEVWIYNGQWANARIW